jgi:outer membrane protein OmpA-like peptidoglycan-associated protein
VLKEYLVNATTALRRLSAVAFSIALAAGMTACSDSPEPTGGLAIVVGGHSNMPPPALAGKAAEAREDALVSQAFLSVVVGDGEPFVMQGAGSLVARDENSVVQKQDRDRNRQAIGDMLAAAKAKTPETDLLAGLSLAARGISSASGKHTIVVVDSGLSTTGALDFAAEPQLLDADPQELADGLAKDGALPDLSGLRVLFQGLGDTVAPQPALDQRQRDNLIAIWNAVIRAAGSSDIVVEQTPLSGTAEEELPYVSPVALKRGSQCVVEEVLLDEGAVPFKADGSEFVDKDRVERVLEPIAQKMLSESLTATLTGTTADVGDIQGQRQLSLQRAEAVRGFLEDLEVTAPMTVVGLGSDFPGYDAGDLAANRKVTVELSAPDAEVTCG